MKDRYAEAERAISAGDYSAAITLLDAIIRDASPKYLNATGLLTDARIRMKESAQRSAKEGRDFENKGDLERALEAYRRARQLDSGLNVEPDIKRVTGMRIAQGRQVCEEANARYSYGRNIEALQLYQEAVKLLPADDPCVVTAKERFSVLRK
jgi:tetratricopeptide (TPR) repeat protein